MLVHDDMFSWEGWGGRLKLGSGKCRLRIYDLKKDDKKGLMHLRPIIVVVSDVPGSEKFDAVEFTWHKDKAIQPKWRTLKPPLLDEIKKLVNS